MAWDFPASPSEGATYTPAGGPTYTYTSGIWRVLPVSQTAMSTANVSDTPPLNPVQGQIWWKSDSGETFIWYVDATGPGQWVQQSDASLPDAPSDGKLYGRRNGSWAETVDPAVHGMQLLNSGTVSVATQYIPMLLTAGYRSYTLRIRRVRTTPANTGYLQAQFSQDNGATWFTSAGNYNWVNKYNGASSDGLGTDGRWSAGGGNTNAAITMVSGLIDAATVGGTSGQIIINRGGSDEVPTLQYHTCTILSGGALSETMGTGFYGAVLPVNAIRLLLSLGNASFASIDWELYGHRGLT